MSNRNRTPVRLGRPRSEIITAVAVGGVIGLLSGLVGTGGGIFLTPLLLFARWSGARAAAGMSSGRLSGRKSMPNRMSGL